MDQRVTISSGSSWETAFGYSRAVRVGNIIEVAGTTAVDGDILIGKGDIYAQTVFIFQKIEKSLQEAGASLNDVVRTRMYVTNIEDAELIGKAHALFFKTIKPVASMIGVNSLINKELLIEIEVTAIVQI